MTDTIIVKRVHSLVRCIGGNILGEHI